MLRYAGKRLLRSEIPLSHHHFQSALRQQYFQPINPFKKSLFRTTCNRCGNQKQSLLGTIPCKRCNREHKYCRKCIQMGRVLECESLYEWIGPEPVRTKWMNPLAWEGTLTSLQEEASHQVIETVQGKQREILVWAVCGAGKTELLFSGIAQALQLGQRICIATPRADVVRELLPRFQKAFPHVSVEGLYGGSSEKSGHSQLILATTHQLLRFHQAFDCMVIDEVDAFPYHHDPMLPYVVSRAVKSTHALIYLTATPRQDLIKRVVSRELPVQFIPRRFHGYPLPVPQLTLSPTLAKTLKQKQTPNAFEKWLQTRNHPQRQLLIFVPTISLLHDLEAPIRALLLSLGVITQPNAFQTVHADDATREEKVLHFRRGDIQVLLTTTILERGVTFPSIDVFIIDAGHTVFDEAALIQIAGRAGRSKTDPDGEVIYLHTGKTRAMILAVRSIKKMNQKGGF